MGNIEEGKDRGGHFWRGCPPEFEPQVAGGGSLDSLKDIGGVDFSDGPGVYRSPHPSQKSPSLSEKSLTPPQKSPDIRMRGTELGGSKEDLLLEAEMAELKLMEERNKKMEEVKKKKQQAQEHFDRLSRQDMGEGARTKHVSHDNIQYNAELLRTKNRVQSQPRNERSGYQGPTISEMRQDQFTNQKVDDMMGPVRNIPAFSNIRDQEQKYPQPRLKKHSQFQGGERKDTSSGNCYSPAQDDEEPLYKMVTKVDNFGVEYRQLVKVTPPRPMPDQRQKLIVDGEEDWFFDQQTGCMYRTGQRYHSPNHHSTVHGPRGAALTSSQNRVYQVKKTPNLTPFQQNTRDRDERFPGIVPLDKDQADQKEGKTPKSIASHARDMPVEYAQSATPKNINFAMFMYGAISELHSSRIGMTAPMEPGVLEAKLHCKVWHLFTVT